MTVSTVGHKLRDSCPYGTSSATPRLPRVPLVRRYLIVTKLDLCDSPLVTRVGTTKSPSERKTEMGTNTPTVIIECACKHCAEYAARKGLTLPLRAKVNVKAHAVLCATAKGRHAQVKAAHAPEFGRYDSLQAKVGPWKVI